MNQQASTYSQAQLAQLQAAGAPPRRETPLEHVRRRAEELRGELAGVEAKKTELAMLERMLRASEER